MTRSRGLLDTSVLIAQETDRPLDPGALPDEFAISVVTVAELAAGVLAAPDTDTAARRLSTLDRISGMTALPIDLAVAREWARLRASLATARRRVAPNDLWIAATAVVHALPLFTQDADFDPLADTSGLTVVRV